MSSRFRDLDYRPLERGAGLRARLRAIGASPRFVIGGTVALLVLVVPVVALAVLVYGGHTEDGGLLFFLGLVAAGGLYAVADVLGQAGVAGALERFAQVNGLRFLSGSEATHYGGHRFSDGSFVVDAAVRSEDEPVVVEVGDMFPASVGSAQDLRTSTAYLRVVVTGALPTGPGEARRLVDADLEDELAALFGPVTIEVGWREVTVYGTRALDPESKGRLAQVLGLAGRVATSASGAATTPGFARRGPSGVTVPVPPQRVEPTGRRLHPLVLVLGTLALMILGPLLIAVVMSNLEPSLRGNEILATAVVGLIVAVVLAVVSGLVRFATIHRRRSRELPGRRR